MNFDNKLGRNDKNREIQRVFIIPWLAQILV